MKFSARDGQVKHATGSLHDSLAVQRKLGIFFSTNSLQKLRSWTGMGPHLKQLDRTLGQRNSDTPEQVLRCRSYT